MRLEAPVDDVLATRILARAVTDLARDTRERERQP